MNTTGKKCFDELSVNPLILKIWDEGSDGFWADIKPGYNFEGCSSIHAMTVKDLYDDASRIESGDPY